jgi:flagellin
MTSILTNTASMIALQTLNATQSSLKSTENAISTGLSVSNAADNASTWAVATTMRKDVSNLMQTSTNLGSANNLVNAALSGATTVASLITSIQSKVTAEAGGTENATDVQNDITALINQIQNVVSGSSYSGVNMLSGSGSMSFAGSVVSNTSGVSQVSLITVSAFQNATSNGANSGSGTYTGMATNQNLNTTTGGGLAALVSDFEGSGNFSAGNGSGGVTASSLSGALDELDDMENDVSAVAASLGSAASAITAQQTFVNNLVDTLQTGVGGLVDADMTEESARLSALQTQQQLGTQALSIANQAPQMILKLFG